MIVIIKLVTVFYILSSICIIIITSQATHPLAVLHDGRLASGSRDKTIRVWDLSSGVCDRVLEGHTSVREGDGCVYCV